MGCSSCTFWFGFVPPGFAIRVSRPTRVLTHRVIRVKLIFASRYSARATVWKSFEIAELGGAMAADTLARMVWGRGEKSAGHPAQSCKQGAGGEAHTSREGGDSVRARCL